MSIFASNINMYISLLCADSDPFSCTFRVRIAVSKSSYTFKLLRKLHTDWHLVCTIYACIRNVSCSGENYKLDGGEWFSLCRTLLAFCFLTNYCTFPFVIFLLSCWWRQHPWACVSSANLLKNISLSDISPQNRLSGDFALLEVFGFDASIKPNFLLSNPLDDTGFSTVVNLCIVNIYTISGMD